MQNRPLLQKMLALIIVLALIGGLVYMLSSRRAETGENPFAQRDEESAHMLQESALELSLESSELNASAAPPDVPTQAPTPEPSAAPTAPGKVRRGGMRRLGKTQKIAMNSALRISSRIRPRN